MFLIFFDVNFIEQYKCTMTNTNTNNYKTWYKFNIIYKKRVKSIFSITFSSHSSSPIFAWGYKPWQFSPYVLYWTLPFVWHKLNSTIFLYLIIIVYNCWHLRIIIMTKLKKKNKLFVQYCCSVILYVLWVFCHWVSDSLTHLQLHIQRSILSMLKVDMHFLYTLQ